MKTCFSKIKPQSGRKIVAQGEACVDRLEKYKSAEGANKLSNTVCFPALKAHHKPARDIAPG